ncbi:MAG: Multicopper oxidase [Frankiales bacterium]|nr:Multicopper oxidase [Frankiales bacterium]
MTLTTRLGRRRIGIGALFGVLAAAALVTTPGNANATSEGVDCAAATNQTFNLTASDGYISTPDGNSIYMWGYGDSKKGFQLPGPTLCVTAGKEVTVVLHNTLPEPTSILFLGVTGVQANGSPAQPQFDGGNSMTSLVQAAPANTGSVTYTFTPSTPGTYLYESGTDADKQVQMGLYGAMIVRPDGHPNQVNDRADSAFKAGNDYVFLLSEIDPAIHLAVERHQPITWNDYTARYFMINGRSMPDTLAPNNAAWLPHQPYGAVVHITPYDETTNPDPAVIRYVNAGSTNYPFHPHGSDERIIGQDGHALAGPNGEDLSYLKYDINVSPGQTIDVLMQWTDIDHWNATDNPIPVVVPPLTDQMVGPLTDTWFSESPYLGEQNALPQGFANNNECGEYYHIAHSHALQQATNYGASFGGMMTVFRIDPPAGCPTN